MKWEITRADKFCYSITDGTHTSPKQQPFGHYLITSKHIKGYQIDFASAYKISDTDYNQIIQRSSVEQWDILYSMIGTIGIVYLEKNSHIEYACKNVCIFKFNQNQNDALWLYYYLQSPMAKSYIQSHLRGSTQSYIPLGDLRELPVALPPKNTRNKIVKILRAFDDKIELNTRINKNLEEQAKAVFKSYYQEAQKTVSFTSVIDVLGGGTPKTAEPTFWNGAIPFFTPKDVGGIYCFTTKKNITENGLRNCNSRLFPKNTTFLTARGTVGKICLAGKSMAMNQSCYALTSSFFDPLLVYFYTLETVRNLRHKAMGAVFDAIVTRDFDTESISLIEREKSEIFVQTIKPIFDFIHTNVEENIKLAAIRDALLPKLMSGELDVSELNL